MAEFGKTTSVSSLSMLRFRAKGGASEEREKKERKGSEGERAKVSSWHCCSSKRKAKQGTNGTHDERASVYGWKRERREEGGTGFAK